MERVKHAKLADAVAAAGVHRSTSHHWRNRAALERAIHLVLMERVKALARGIDFMQYKGEQHDSERGHESLD